jgi:hypothetical protein
MTAMRLFFLFIAVCFSYMSTAQPRINLALKKELDSMLVQDQYYRELLSAGTKINSDSLSQVFHVSREELPNYLWTKQNQIDSANTRRVQVILNQYGYPGKTLVGAPTNEAVFYVLQHSSVIDQYLPLVQKAAENKELPFHLYGMMLDRSLMYAGKEQVYGSQGKGIETTNPLTGKKEWQMFIWPIKDAATVNARRKAAGFERTVEDHAKNMGIDYKVLTLADVAKMN